MKWKLIWLIKNYFLVGIIFNETILSLNNNFFNHENLQ